MIGVAVSQWFTNREAALKEIEEGVTSLIGDKRTGVFTFVLGGPRGSSYGGLLAAPSEASK